MKLCKLLLAVVGASVLLGALVSTASANRLSSSTQAFRATWTAAVFKGGFQAAKCNLTLEGSLHSATITKTAEALIGYITRASVGPCPNGSATVLTETLPWHVRYAGFAGTLPNITSLITHVTNSHFQIEEAAFGITCLATSEPAHPAIGTYNLNASHAVTSVSLGGTINCEGVSGSLEGTSSTNSALTITLI